MSETRYEIQLYCQEPSHAEKCWNVCRFFGRIDEDGEPSGGWMIDFLSADQPIKRQMLAGNRRLPHVIIGDESDCDEKSLAGRWPLRCRKCNLSVPIREGTAMFDRLMSMLDELARHGVSEVSLAAIAARVR
jgi:hypothetical protein